jgi:hypothetical protein
LIKFKFYQICLNSFKRVRSNSLFRPNSLFIQPVYQWIRPVYRQNRPIFIGWGFHCSHFESNEFGRFFWKPTTSEGVDFLVSTGFLNPAQGYGRWMKYRPTRMVFHSPTTPAPGFFYIYFGLYLKKSRNELQLELISKIWSLLVTPVQLVWLMKESCHVH